MVENSGYEIYRHAPNLLDTRSLRSTTFRNFKTGVDAVYWQLLLKLASVSYAAKNNICATVGDVPADFTLHELGLLGYRAMVAVERTLSTLAHVEHGAPDERGRVPHVGPGGEVV